MKRQKLSHVIAILTALTLSLGVTAVYAQEGRAPKKTEEKKAKDQETPAAPDASNDASNFLMPLQPGDDPSGRLGLDQVMWSNEGVEFESLKGKSVLLFVYATWCPLCNKWSTELFQQMMMATNNRPVVILAINADEKDPTLKYVIDRNFNAPNILHGYDPNMTFRLGYKNNLFRYVWIGPDGLVKEEGYMGGSNPVNPDVKDGPEVFVLAKKLHEAQDLGEFEVIQPELSAEVAAMLWPLELGQPLDSTALIKARRLLKGEEKEAFEKALDSYLDRQVEKITSLSQGSVADRLEAYTKADPFVKQFRSFPQAKPIRDILDTLKKDRDFKKELSAMQLYEKATVKGLDPQRRLGMLRGLVKRFEGTHYATKAAGEVQ